MNALHVDRKAPVERIALDERAWVDVVRGFVRDPRLFARLRDDLHWRQEVVIRNGRKVADPRLVAGLSARDAERGYPALHHARLVLEARYRVRFQRGVGITLYRNGRDRMGLHRDDELRYLSRTVISGLCLGESRPLLLQAVRTQSRRVIELHDGDLYVMGGRCQADWLHGIPSTSTQAGRISCVWRWTSRTGPPSSSPTHHVEDAPASRRRTR